MLNIILSFVLIALFLIGLVRFKMSKQQPTHDVPHIEVFPDIDPVKFHYKELYGYYGKGAEIMQKFWSHQRNKIYKERNK